MEGGAEVTAGRPRNPASIDPDLVRVDQLCDAWSRDGNYIPTRSSLHPLEAMRLKREGELLGIDVADEEALFHVDQVILKSPARIRTVITVWYKNPGPADVKAKRLGLSRAALYIEWRMALVHLRAVLMERGVAV